MIDAAYEVFIQGATHDEMKSYIFELQTKAMMYLNPERIREYLKIIREKDGLETCQNVIEHVIVVYAKFLQIMVWILHMLIKKKCKTLS